MYVLVYNRFLKRKRHQFPNTGKSTVLVVEDPIQDLCDAEIGHCFQDSVKYAVRCASAAPTLIITSRDLKIHWSSWRDCSIAIRSVSSWKHRA